MTYSDFDLLQAYIFRRHLPRYDDPQVGDWFTSYGYSSRYAYLEQVTAVDGETISYRVKRGASPWEHRTTYRHWFGGHMLVPKLFTTVVPPDDGISA